MSEISEDPVPTEGPGPTPAPPATMPAVEEAFDEIDVDEPLVGIIMGSKNDKPKLQPAGEALRDHAIRYEVRVLSAHRDPDATSEYCTNARMRGLKVIIAGAGMSAALLPGPKSGEQLDQMAPRLAVARKATRASGPFGR